MKKLLALLLILAMCVSVCAFAVSCSIGGSEDPETPDNGEGGEAPDDGEGGEAPDDGEGGGAPDDGEDTEDEEDGPPTGDWLPID